jgi:hypothetical protein
VRRLTAAAALGTVLLTLLAGCRPRDKIRVEATDEGLNLKSAVHMADPEAARQLISGFHQIEQNSWRWTMGRFAVMLKPPTNVTAGARLRVHLSVPDAVLDRTGPVTLTAILNGRKLGSKTWSAAGEYTFEAPVPAAALGPEPITVDFAVDKFLPAGTVETRELGLIVSSVEISST